MLVHPFAKMSDHCCQHHAPEDSSSQPSTLNSQPPFGIENPRGLDALAFDGETGEAVLIMVEPRAWDGSRERLVQLEGKVNAYLSFVLDGEMTDAFPHLIGKPVRIQLDCAVAPDPSVEQFVAAVREHIALQDMKFAVRIVGEAAPEGEAAAQNSGSCGTGCGCH